MLHWGFPGRVVGRHVECCCVGVECPQLTGCNLSPSGDLMKSEETFEKEMQGTQSVPKYQTSNLCRRDVMSCNKVIPWFKAGNSCGQVRTGNACTHCFGLPRSTRLGQEDLMHSDAGSGLFSWLSSIRISAAGDPDEPSNFGAESKLSKLPTLIGSQNLKLGTKPTQSNRTNLNLGHQ